MNILTLHQSMSNYSILQIHKSGRMMCVGASDGSTSVIQLDESLSTCSKLDRTNANDMFDRWLFPGLIKFKSSLIELDLFSLFYM